MTANDIRYLYSAGAGMELIFCKDSTISYPLHNHVSVLTIGILLEGSLVLTKNGKASVYRPNETFAIFPYAPHSISARGRYTLLSLCIDKRAANGADIAALRERIRLLLERTPDMGRLGRLQTESLLSCLQKAAAFPDQSLKIHTPYIQDLKRRLEAFPERRLTVGEMAQNAHISKYHLIRSFKAEVGLTPHQFQIQNRVRKAQRLIHESATLTETALTAGFCDQSHFIKQFKRQVGLPPLTYRSSSKTIP